MNMFVHFTLEELLVSFQFGAIMTYVSMNIFWKYLEEPMYIFLWDLHLIELELLWHRIYICSTLVNTAKKVPEWWTIYLKSNRTGLLATIDWTNFFYQQQPGKHSLLCCRLCWLSLSTCYLSGPVLGSWELEDIVHSWWSVGMFTFIN